MAIKVVTWMLFICGCFSMFLAGLYELYLLAGAAMSLFFLFFLYYNEFVLKELEEKIKKAVEMYVKMRLWPDDIDKRG